MLAYPKLWHTPKLPGLGDVRWGAFLGALAEAGYDGHVAIEVEDRAFEGSIEKRQRVARHQPPFSPPVHGRAETIDRDDPTDIDRRQAPTTRGPIDLSVLVPVYNEVDNVGPLHEELDAVLRGTGLPYELIFVDDGSTDGTAARLAAIQDADPEHVLVAFLKRNCGQTAALSAALDLARGDDPRPDGRRPPERPGRHPPLLRTLDQGFDVVSGWRRDRQDTFLTRKVPSWVANRLVARISGVPLHDFGCTMKAYRRRVLEGVRLYGEMHRFIPIFASWQGAKVTELVVNHRPRIAGRTKYGLGRTFNVVLDLILIRFFQRYSQRPIHLFGRVGLWSIFLSFLVFGLMLYTEFVGLH